MIPLDSSVHSELHEFWHIAMHDHWAVFLNGFRKTLSRANFDVDSGFEVLSTSPFDAFEMPGEIHQMQLCYADGEEPDGDAPSIK